MAINDVLFFRRDAASEYGVCDKPSESRVFEESEVCRVADAQIYRTV